MTTTTWAVLGESVTGTGHRGRNALCQDALRFQTFGPADEWLVVAVADGAGTARHSDVGAMRACDELVRLVTAAEPVGVMTRDGVTALFAEARETVFTEAERLNVRPRELACTALLAVVGPESAALAQLGDGGIVLGGGQDYRTVFWPEPAEYANATDFLTDDRFADALRFEATAAPVSEVAVFTDGLQRLALDFAGLVPHPPFFRPLFAGLRAAADPETLVEPFRAFLDSPRVSERTDDDKTLVLAIRRP